MPSPRIATREWEPRYTTYLDDWKSSGGTLFMHFNDTYPPSQYGMWGLLESTMQSTQPLSSAPPKWQAVQNFISANKCWWADCEGAMAGVPKTLRTRGARVELGDTARPGLSLGVPVWE